MFQAIRAAIVIAAISISVSAGVTSALAQAVDKTDGATTTTRPVRVDNDGFNPGWIGLLGLAGLAGLIPKNRNVHHVAGDTASGAPIRR